MNCVFFNEHKYTQKSKENQPLSPRRRLLSAVCLLLVTFFFIGCGRKQADPEHVRIVNAYARLTLLHEQDKIVSKVPDSLYRIRVGLLFDSLKMTQDEFRADVESRTETNTAMKSFMTDVQREMLEIRRQREKRPAK
ncbi:MAG: hypothetical protein NTV54_02165 [Ignavibacteriales bacterium]|nr:hypothetical protein [Ignavibacteriales bacterium]